MYSITEVRLWSNAISAVASASSNEGAALFLFSAQETLVCSRILRPWFVWELTRGK